MTFKLPQKGFTIIELLIVISIIAILAGITISIIDPDAQANRAEDGVRLANLEKIIQGIEAYSAAEGAYPVDTSGNGNPLDDANGLDTYLRVWPTDEPPGSIYSYAQGGGTFGVQVNLAENGCFYKFHSSFNEIRTCFCGGTAEVNVNSTGC